MRLRFFPNGRKTKPYSIKNTDWILKNTIMEVKCFFFESNKTLLSALLQKRGGCTLSNREEEKERRKGRNARRNISIPELFYDEDLFNKFNACSCQYVSGEVNNAFSITSRQTNSSVLHQSGTVTKKTDDVCSEIFIL
ncbi:hypothetical protein NPIL_296901 [Nephila pilipes]|uniref:Uncharacterized protein n=1 Tax=Nephila pilipes TaxID=299642 RepID=A0A8X6NEX0_NEPPI|nr:hypothetical protein NPIL_296901 [Nephila pilipes]